MIQSENILVQNWPITSLDHCINKSQSASRYLKNYKMLRIKSYLKLYTL